MRILGTEREFFSGDLRCRLYPLVNVNKKLWKIIIFIGKSTRNGQFSIANCLFTRGYIHVKSLEIRELQEDRSWDLCDTLRVFRLILMSLARQS